MYVVTPNKKYKSGVEYYTKSGNIYTKLVEGTDYTVDSTISGTKYNNFDIDKVYIDAKPLPYTPIHDAAQHDVDFDAYTNTKGVTVRNRVRSNVKTLDFNYPVMNTDELYELLKMTDPASLQVSFFDEHSNTIVTKKMYCSGDVTYHKEYIDNENPSNNIYTDIVFGLVEF